MHHLALEKTFHTLINSNLSCCCLKFQLKETKKKTKENTYPALILIMLGIKLKPYSRACDISTQD